MELTPYFKFPSVDHRKVVSGTPEHSIPEHKGIILAFPEDPKPFIHQGHHVIYLMDPVTGTVQKRNFGPDLRLGAVED